MNGVGKGTIAFFGGVGVLMVLVAREFKDRGGDVGAASSTFYLIGSIWTAVAIFLLLLFLLIGRSSRRADRRRAELLRDSSEGPDVPQI